MSFFERLLGGHRGRGHGGSQGGHQGDRHGGGHGRHSGGAALPAGGPLCPDCGANNAAKARFCQQCGTSLQPAACRQCGNTLAAGARFCAQCGGAAG
ncbi:zinc-ribbon domain-containing protein [Pseudomonas chlororaphis]|uniref:Zinc-ribbon domain-containing protein n=1 Tax=Pseudomonas chlororaphis TaxID=587753 RepID=A0AB34C584_9PSED|nr:zinc ribbon domain-containing protein [Pseudomonas chlororaphis]KAA5842385.1 zinc-ribbon domain-containing protein [Pseudomonas chlororaphis]